VRRGCAGGAHKGRWCRSGDRGGPGDSDLCPCCLFLPLPLNPPLSTGGSSRRHGRASRRGVGYRSASILWRPPPREPPSRIQPNAPRWHALNPRVRAARCLRTREILEGRHARWAATSDVAANLPRVTSAYICSLLLPPDQHRIRSEPGVRNVVNLAPIFILSWDQAWCRSEKIEVVARVFIRWWVVPRRTRGTSQAACS